MKIQIAAAAPMTARRLSLVAFHRVRTASWKMKKYSKVLANTSSIHRCSVSSNAVTPTRR